jgi:hypothetical protein
MNPISYGEVSRQYCLDLLTKCYKKNIWHHLIGGAELQATGLKQFTSHFYLPSDYNTLRGYYDIVYSCTTIARMRYSGDRIGVHKLENDKYLIDSLLTNDLKRCHFFICLMAWISYSRDESILANDPSIPEDLHYGLILEYPEVIFAYAEYICSSKERRKELKQTISKDSIENNNKIITKLLLKSLRKNVAT